MDWIGHALDLDLDLDLDCIELGYVFRGLSGFSGFSGLVPGPFGVERGRGIKGKLVSVFWWDLRVMG